MQKKEQAHKIWKLKRKHKNLFTFTFFLFFYRSHSTWKIIDFYSSNLTY